MGEIIGHKDRQIWSSSNALLVPSFDHSNKNQKSVENYHRHGSGGFRRPGAPPLRETLPLNTRQRQQSNWQTNKGDDDRMQAFFLISPGRTASGTGVFLPATAFQPTKKPACSPVLLPARVVQALNLNVHNNGIHISPPRSEIRENESKKISEMVATLSMDTKVETPIDSLESSSDNSSESSSENSPENFLPEEWIY